MAAFNTLTADQQAMVTAFMPIFRGNIGNAARFFNRMAQMVALYGNNVSALVTSLDVGTPIPDTSGLAGAATLTRENVLGIMTAITNMLTTYNTAGNQTLFASTAGPSNTQGT